MSAFKSYRDLEVWQCGMRLAKDIYNATSSLPSHEKFGLTSQMRRAAVSIPSNIAEGHARSGTGEFAHFVSISMGSIAELETQVILSFELGYITQEIQDSLLAQLNIVGKMSRGLLRSLTNRRNA